MKLIVGNMKMNMSLSDIKYYIENLNYKDNVVICPTSIYIPYFMKYNVGIQNMFYEDHGAYTGEVSPSQCSSLNVKYAIIGHSERRNIFNESDETINKKLASSIKNSITPILCVGEHDGEDRTMILSNELDKDLSGLENIDKIIIAYEPIWAIGTGKIPTNEEIFNTIKFIKDYILNKYKVNVKVLYGGSVNEKNIDTLNQISNLDGFLIGGASTKVNEFNKIIEVTE
ncbi:MAG: triose-phosphate isomerase [Bacilli bacterium]|nr:triose-phosphate isomerase [Bacilli bacterium]